MNAELVCLLKCYLTFLACRSALDMVATQEVFIELKNECINHGVSAGIVALSCPTLYNSLDWSPPGSSVHGILQARMQEWVAMPFSRGSS